MPTYKCRIEQDVAKRRILIRLFDPATGLSPEGAPFIRLELDELRYATPSGTDSLIEAYLRRVHFTDASDGSKQRCYGLFTAPEPDDEDDGHSDDLEDLYLGGGGGGFQVFRVKEVFGLVLRCHQMDGETEGTTDVYVAKSPDIRHGDADVTETVEGTGLTISYQTRTNNSDGQRTVSDGSYAQIEIVLPTWKVDVAELDRIVAVRPSGGTGVTVGVGLPGAGPVEWLDLNIDARRWCQVS